MTRRLDWAEYRFAELAGSDPSTTIAILPVAAIEQHGPHLPVGTDAIIADGMLAQLREDVPENLDIRILPVQQVGKSNEHVHAAGTLTLNAQTALAAWTEIGLSVARSGIRKIVIVSSHGGNTDLVSILSRELRVQANMLAVKCSWGSFGYPEGLFSEFELTHGLHGGDIETSLVLAFAPHTVDMELARYFGTTADDTPIPPTGAVSYGWVATDLNISGVVGEAHLATSQKGWQTVRHQVAGFIGMLKDVRRMDGPGRE